MPARRKKATEPCQEHYPDGFPDGVDGVGCEHGTWTREGKTSDPKTSGGESGSGSGEGEGDGSGDGEGAGE